MFFLVDDTNKILFGWSAKCGCTHIKHIYWFLQNVHKSLEKPHYGTYNKLPENTEDYTIIIICRSPYKRLVSGFLEKYKSILARNKVSSWCFIYIIEFLPL